MSTASTDPPFDLAEAESWVRSRIPITTGLVLFQAEPWASVYRAETDEGPVWFKACAPTHAFEVPLTAALADRSNVVTDVLADDAEQAWLLMADAGRPLWDFGNPPERWLQILPRYAELQIGEMDHADQHLAVGVPDLTVARLPGRYEELLAADLPLDAAEMAVLEDLRPRFAEACEALDATGPGSTVQHDDLHMNNVYLKDDQLRVLDWGDASISQPFFSLFETFRFLVQENGLSADDPWFARLREAYLEPWEPAQRESFDLAFRISGLAHAVACLDQRATVSDADRPEFDEWFAGILQLALRRATDPGATTMPGSHPTRPE